MADNINLHCSDFLYQAAVWLKNIYAFTAVNLPLLTFSKATKLSKQYFSLS